MDADNGYEDYQTGRQEYRPGYAANGSFIDIPGDQFPSIRQAQLPTVEPIMGLATTATATTMTSGRTIIWQSANASSEGFITINIQVGTLSQFENGSGYSFQTISALECTAPDTGVYEVPVELDALLMEGSQSVERVSLRRDAFSAVQTSDALLFMRAISDASITIVE